MHLLLVEDDVNLGRALVKVLKERYRVNWVRTLEAAQAHFRTADYDALLLDLGLPDGDGVAWLTALRSAGCAATSDAGCRRASPGWTARAKGSVSASRSAGASRTCTEPP